MTESFLKGPLAGKLFRFALPSATMYLSFPCSFPCSSAYLWGPTLHWPRPSVPAKKQRPAKSCIRRCSFPYSSAWSLPVSAKSSSGRSWPAIRSAGWLRPCCSPWFIAACGGGYTLAASQTDKRIKAVAALSMFNSGRVRRNGFQDKQIATIQQRLADASEARNEELKGNVEYVGFLPPHKDDNELRKIMEAQPEGIYKDGIDYYGLSYRSSRATGSYTKESFLKLMAFDVEDHMDLINQPLPMVAGSAADTLYMTEDAFEKAVNAKNKELYLIPGASHIKTYWQPDFVKQELAKFEEFFGKNL